NPHAEKPGLPKQKPNQAYVAPALIQIRLCANRNIGKQKRFRHNVAGQHQLAPFGCQKRPRHSTSQRPTTILSSPVTRIPKSPEIQNLPHSNHLHPGKYSSSKWQSSFHHLTKI